MTKTRQNDPIVIGDGNNHQQFYNFNIEPYFGDPESLQWFITQIRELKDLNDWDDKAALFFLKTKLKGSAQTFFQTSPACQSIQNFDEALTILANFFGNKLAPASAISNFNNIYMLPNESIRNLAHRIEIAAHAAYDFIQNDEALNKIKSIQLLNAIPVAIKTQLIFEDPKNFNNIVNKASQIQESSLNSVQVNYVQNNQNSSKEVGELKNKVEELTHLVQNLISKCLICYGEHKVDNCPQLRNKPNQHNNKPNEHVPICQFCNKRGHIMPKCFQFLRTLNQPNNTASNDRQNQPLNRNRTNFQRGNNARHRTFNNSNTNLN